MPGFMRDIHVFFAEQLKDVDGRDKPGPDALLLASGRKRPE